MCEGAVNSSPMTNFINREPITYAIYSRSMVYVRAIYACGIYNIGSLYIHLYSTQEGQSIHKISKQHKFLTNKRCAAKSALRNELHSYTRSSFYRWSTVEKKTNH